MKQTIMAVIMVLAMVSGAWAEPEPLQFYPIINVTSETCELDCTYEKPCMKRQTYTIRRPIFKYETINGVNDPIKDSMEYNILQCEGELYYYCIDGIWRQKESASQYNQNCKVIGKDILYMNPIVDNPFKEGE